MSLRLWDKSGDEIKTQTDYLRLIKNANSTTNKTLHLFLTVGQGEKYRIYNGAFLYLLTQGKDAVDDWMSRSLFSIDRNFNAKFGPYPVIIFHNVDHRLIQSIVDLVKPKNTRMYWVPVHHLFDKYLPELTVFENTIPSNNISFCAKKHWRFEYVQMIRFRSIRIPRQSILAHRCFRGSALILSTFSVTDMWKMPILQYFDHVLSIDADATIHFSDFDFFEQAAKSGRYIGYQKCSNDWACAIGLKDKVEEYIQDRGIQPYHWNILPADTAYYGFFIMFDVNFWRSHRGVADFLECILCP